MDKKFYYKTPAIVAMTLAGTTLVTHQVNAEETKSNKDSNIIEQHDNANQIQKEKQELQNQSLNISGSKEYKDPSIIDDVETTEQQTSNETTQENNYSNVANNSIENSSNQEKAQDDATSDNVSAEDNTSDVEQDTDVNANDQKQVKDDNASDDTTSDNVTAEDNSSDVEQDSDVNANDQEQAEDDNASDDATSDNVSAEDNASDVEQDSDVNANDQEQVKDDNASDDATSDNVSAEDNASDVEQDSDVNANDQEQVKDDNASDDATSDNVSAEDNTSDVEQDSDVNANDQKQVKDDNSSDVEQDSDVNANDQEQAEDDNASDDATSDNVSAEDNASDVEQDSDVNANDQEQVKDDNASDDATSDNVSAEDNASDIEQVSDEKANDQEQVKDDNASDDATSDNVSAEDNASDVEQDNNENIKEQSKEDNTSNDAESDENNQTNQANETNISEPKVASKNAEIQSRSAAPQSNSTKYRTAVNAPSTPKVRAANVQYEAAVNSSINNQIRNNNYTVPKYVEDFSSHIPKIPYRNGVGKPEGIVAHETANPNSTIHNEIAYMKNNYESAFVHAYVDDNNIIEVAPTDYLAWGAGAQANPRFIHVELVRVYGSDRFARSINNYADYIATNLAYYGLSLDSAERDGVGTLWSHDAVSKFLGGTDHSDPYGWFAENNYTFDELVDLVTEKYQYKTGLLTAPTKPETTKPVTKPTTKPSQNTTKPSNPTVSKPSTKPTVSKPNTKPSKPVVSKPSTKPEAKPSKPVVSKPANTIVVDYVGKVNTNASGVYTSVYDNQQKSAANKAGKTFKIGKQSTYNNQVFYLLQDNNSTPLGWVKASDVQLQSSVKPKPTQKPNNTVVKPKPVESTSKEQTSNVKPVSKSDVSSVVNPKPVAQNNNTAVKPKPTVSTNKVQTNNAKPVTQPAASTAVKSKPAAQTNNKVAKPSQVAQANKNYTANTERVNYVGTVNKNISGVYTSVYNDKTVPAVNKAGKTFKIGKQSVINNQTFYLLQDNNAIPLGWVKSQDVQLQNATKPKTVTQPTVTPKKTEAIKASTVNNTPIAYQENYTNYLITDNTGYFYSEPYASKNTLLGSLQNYHYAYFKVITSQQIGNELWYKGILNGQTVWINAIYLQIAETSTKSSTSPYTLDEAVDIQMALKNGTEPKKVLPSGVRKATRAEVKDAMDTSKYIDDPVQKYQFLDLNQSQNIPVSKLNELLRGKGILENQGEAFSEAAKSVGVNEIYLISHALLETGNGTSDLAKGGSINSDGKVDLKSDTKYYNMFGVGAIDDNALYGGIKYAQQAGWDTPSKAIFGGAQFISSNYINAGQNTLYKMRFNPQNPGEHQYATGVDFSTSNAKRISDFYQQIQTDGEYYDFDRYKS
ncbi:bifunctional autolysin precursor [Mammaliicoccus lentus]|uniref:glucosaminidase domain-containing protein n=1 Tax=Mammaliicoccus lentus TaxID=42858 RepID=UPI00085CA0F0|nr:glucosaminidase domain-containing protein [Mammaliicoccus lentus]SCU47296.1 bifunctional autolysin precursor [Mammaliicoccus lentus]